MRRPPVPDYVDPRDPPVVDPYAKRGAMAYTDARIPFSGNSPLSRHHSYEGAVAAEPKALPLVLRYLALLRTRYPDGLTDQEAADRLGVLRSSINGRRGELEAIGLVVAAASRLNEATGVANTVYRLSVE